MERKEQKKAEIISIMHEFKDEFGNIDIAKLRKEKPNVYARISYNFGSIDQAVMEAMGGNKGTSVNKQTLRNQLAYDMLRDMREERKMTLEEIGNIYGVSRAHVNQLYKSLAKTFGDSNIEVDEA